MSSSLQSPTYQELRRLLTEARRNAGLTQTQVADKLKRPQSFISKWEGAQRHLDIVEFLALCDALNVSAIDVIANLGSPFWVSEQPQTVK